MATRTLPAKTVGTTFKLDEGQLSGLLQHLKTLPEKIEQRVLRKAGRTASNTFLQLAIQRTPKSDKKPAKYRGKPHLRDVLAIKQKTYGRGGKARTFFVIGPKSKQAPHGHLVEFGTAQRFTGSQTKYKTVTQGRIKTKSGWKNRRKKVSIGSFEKFPGAVMANRGVMPAFAMLQKSFTRGRQFAQRAMEAEIKAGIEREARR